MANLKQIVRFSFGFLLLVSCVLGVVYGEEEDKIDHSKSEAVVATSVVMEDVTEWDFFLKFANSLKGSSGYTPVWPEFEIGWRLVVGTLIAFLGAAFGSAGGVGAGGIFVPLLTLVIGFDPKSSTAISKCMISGLSAATVYFNIRQKHPTLDSPLIDYELALIVQPMLLLGISTGVILNVVFASWMVTVLLIVAFLGTSMRSYFKAIEMWRKETIKKKEEARHVQPGQSGDAIEYEPLRGGPSEQPRTSLVQNVDWKQLGILTTVWLAFLAVQVVKDFTSTCSLAYWLINSLQIPVGVGATLYQARKMLRGGDVNVTEEMQSSSTSSKKLIFCALVSLLAGILGGLLGLGGGFLLAPMFLELNIIPQVSSATATFVMTFSASLCAIEYYLLDRFPVPYTAYLVFIATIASLTGQYFVKRWIQKLGRASLIVFILATIIFTSAILLGGQGIADMVYKINHNQYMGFEDLCIA